MSIKQTRRIKYGKTECGFWMSKEQSPWIHVLGVIFAMVVMLFSYAALLENGIMHSIAGFLFGFVFLFYLHGQTFDRFYIHLGDKIKIGGDAYDPNESEHSSEKIELERKE